MKPRTPPPRYQTHLEGKYQIAGSAGAFVVTLLNVSSGGCALETAERQEVVGTQLQIQLVLPTDETVSLTGTVVWSSSSYHTVAGRLIVPAAAGVAYIKAPLPKPYQHYIECCSEAPQAIDSGYAVLFESVVRRWAESTDIPVKSRFLLGLHLTTDLIAAYAVSEARELLAEAVDLALENKEEIPATTLATATRLYAGLMTIGRRGENPETRKAQLDALRRQVRM